MSLASTEKPRPSLPPRQRKVLEFVATHIQGKGYAPSVREIAKHFGMKSTNAVDSVLGVLEVKGFVRRAPNKARGIQVLHTESDDAATSYSEVVEDMMQERIAKLDEAIAILRAALGKGVRFAEAIGEEFSCDREGANEGEPDDHLGPDDDPSDCWRCWSLYVKRAADAALSRRAGT